jgi:hypothetical protein
MALIPTINITQADNGVFITLYDTTGIYDVNSNPGGYGNPPANPDVIDITAATLELLIMAADGTYSTVYGPTSVVSGTPPAQTFPTDDITNSIDITVDLDDGYYKAIYVVTASAVDYTATEYFTFYADARCCFKQKALAVENCNCDCSGKKLDLIEMHIALEAIETAAADENAVNVYNAIAYAEKLCRNCCGCH